MPEHPLLITPECLAARLDDAQLCVIDCRFDLTDPARGRRDFDAGHVPGAVHADLDRDLAGPVRPETGRHPLPDPSVFARTLGRWGIDRGTDVVVYDALNGATAARAWWLLRWMGHERVSLLDGGFEHWLRGGHPVSAEASARPATTFYAHPGSAATLSTSEVAEALRSDGSLLLVDARDAVRFRGDAEPIDPIAGHVPGARNVPLAASLRADGRWRAADELRRLWEPLLGTPPGRPWAVMCGSGVTACHLAVSAGLAGFQAPSLYVGSWSEWIRDSRRPVAVGAAG